MTIKEMIPFIFRDLFRNPDLYSYLDFYEDLSSSGVKALIFDELNDENAHQFFTGEPCAFDETSSRLTTIRCNFLHVAIWLQRADVVSKLLNDYCINPELSLEYTQGNENEYDLSHLGMNDDKLFFAMSPLSLAQRTGNTQILELLRSAISASNTVVNSAPPMPPINREVNSAPPMPPMNREVNLAPPMPPMNREVNSAPLMPSMNPVGNLAPSLSVRNPNGYEADVDERASEKPPRYKSRLILGDGNFSYSRALVRKQQEKGLQQFAAALTVTEYANEKSLARTYAGRETAIEFMNFRSNAATLHEQGAAIYFGVDAGQIHRNLAGNRYKRIHFNFPYFNHPSLNPSENKAQTRLLVGRFFASATQLQEPGDRIHMALVTGFRDPVWYENATYGVGAFCEQYGYAYISKRKFVDGAKKRYPGYFHVKTACDATVQTAEKGREFIFEKKIPGKIYAHSTEKRPTCRGAITTVLKAVETDSDSSSYVEDSEMEQTTERRLRK